MSNVLVEEISIYITKLMVSQWNIGSRSRFMCRRKWISLEGKPLPTKLPSQRLKCWHNGQIGSLILDICQEYLINICIQYICIGKWSSCRDALDWISMSLRRICYNPWITCMGTWKSMIAGRRIWTTSWWG